ncbi:exo-alpha-sialidase [Paenibacillus hemerocallicola]|uniref:Exo-alpha-sialidase n=1 Tax=Paenibacillus hemerocallicola TaxID=1172614 RepID=A0A5C4TBC3_9BACL|nr:sialidase family protein [Paenibacillus hemerocallicola]TNJ66202.1 exo-alpha-sialidase [Paenibacillus hemerocallicola]
MDQKGTIVLDLRPGPGNPRNSEGAFLDLRDGRLMFAYSRFNGDSSHDNAKACIAVRFSSDEGGSWTGDEIIARPEDHDAINIMSVSLLRLGNGDIGLFYLLRFGWHDMRLHLRRSADEGTTWGDPVCCVQGKGYYVTNNDRVIRLASGRLVVPAALHRVKSNEESDWGQFDSRGITFFFLSDDDGATWREARNYCSIGVPNTRSDMQEPGVIELHDGVLWGWARTDLGCQYETYSHDGGVSWSTPVPSQFSSPCSPLSMKRNPDNGHLLAVWNPIPAYNTRRLEKHSWGRTPLIGAISKDEGKTWERHFAVEREEDGNGCCYVAIHFTGSSVFLAYCAGEAEDDICLTRLKIRKMDLAELYA